MTTTDKDIRKEGNTHTFTYKKQFEITLNLEIQKKAIRSIFNAEFMDSDRMEMIGMAEVRDCLLHSLAIKLASYLTGFTKGQAPKEKRGSLDECITYCTDHYDNFNNDLQDVAMKWVYDSGKAKKKKTDQEKAVQAVAKLSPAQKAELIKQLMGDM